MAESSWPTATGTGVTGTTWEQMAVNFFADGLFGLPTQTPLVFADSTGRQVKLHLGRLGSVRGFTWTSGGIDLVKSVTPNTTAGTTRIDRVVLGLNRSGAWPVTAYVKAGTAATTNPQPPVLQQDPTSGGTGIFEIPLAKITSLVTGFTTVTPSQIVPEAWYLGPPSITATSTTMPSAATLGLRVYQSDTGLSLIGTGTAFKAALDDTGDLPVGPAANWTSTMKVRKFNGVVYPNGFGFVRTGAQVAANTDQTLGWVPVGCHPATTVSWAAYISGGAIGNGTVEPNGSVVLRDYWIPVGTGKFVIPKPSPWVAA